MAVVGATERIVWAWLRNELDASRRIWHKKLLRYFGKGLLQNRLESEGNRDVFCDGEFALDGTYCKCSTVTARR